MEIRIADNDGLIARCHPVMAELRTQYDDRDAFVAQVRRQIREQRYAIAFVEDASAITAVAGYRIVESLAWGRAMYIDDLITSAQLRSKGHGSALFDWLVDRARQEGCGQFHLDSGVQRFDAHRFYLRKRMVIASHHFSLEL